MLNSDLFLNSKLFDEDVEKKATRDGYGSGLEKLGETNPNVVVLTADLADSTKCGEFAGKYPDRFFDCGVAEQNMAAIASGLSATGKIPFISSYAVFSPGKNLETIRTTIVYNRANVKIAGHHAGIATGPDGATHQATEDIAITRSWPGVEVLNPCDSIEAEKATIHAGSVGGPVYLRFTRDKTPTITTDKTPFDRQSRAFWVSDNPQVAIFGTGYMLFYALLAARDLEKEGINVLVVNIATIKPLDEKNILSLISETKAAVSVEDHQVMGGMGSALSELFAKTNPIPMEFIGLQDTFAESGDPKKLIEKYKMDEDAIVRAVKKVIGRK